MSVTPIKRHAEVPPCVGDPTEWWEGSQVGHEPAPCRMRTRHLVVGSDVIKDRLAMVVVGACPLHRRAVEQWVSLPYGAYTVEASQAALDAVVEGLREQGEDVWVAAAKVA